MASPLCPEPPVPLSGIKTQQGCTQQILKKRHLTAQFTKKGRDQFNLVQLSADKLQEDTKFNCAMPSESADHPSHTQKMPSGHNFNYGEVNMSSISEKRAQRL